MRKLLPLLGLLGCLFVLQSLPSEAQTGRGPLVVAGRRGMSRTYTVNGRSVSVSGNGHRIVLRGRCPSLRVTGTNNRVYVDSARSIVVSGRNNRVYWSGLYDGKSPRISRTGVGNQVLRRARR